MTEINNMIVQGITYPSSRSSEGYRSSLGSFDCGMMPHEYLKRRVQRLKLYLLVMMLYHAEGKIIPSLCTVDLRTYIMRGH